MSQHTVEVAIKFLVDDADKDEQINWVLDEFTDLGASLVRDDYCYGFEIRNTLVDGNGWEEE